MPADSHSCTPPFAPIPHDAENPPTSQPIDRDQIARLRRELQLKDRELDDLRGRLRDIHTSDAWAMIRTLSQVRQALAPHGTRRDRVMKQGIRGLRRLKKGVASLAQSTWSLSPSSRRLGTREIRIDPTATGEYAVVCLPMIEWGFRFQRPQQIMRQFAREGHPVLYAANRFHRGQDVRTHLIETNVFEIALPGDPAANVYQMLPADSDVLSMVEAFERLRTSMNQSDAVVVAQLPYWSALAEALRDRYGWPIIYDCMDDHSGFLHNSQEVLRAEERLVLGSNLVVASSERLLAGVRVRARASMLLRNACEYDHFAGVAPATMAGRETTRVGYYGAIAEWFDSRLVADLAELRPDWSFELIGSTLAGDVRRLEGLPNVRLLGERPYGDLPRCIGDWDAFLIPFKRVPLTEATNPVKVYEMLATGKPVVAVSLPELVPIAEEGLIRLGDTAEQFSRAIESELRNAEPGLAERRRAFARANTWNARYVELAAAIERILHRVVPAEACPWGSAVAVSSRA
jgi:glycosyltransferase involved in cell wall biosynthesis